MLYQKLVVKYYFQHHLNNSVLFEDVFTRIEDEKNRYKIISWNLQVCNLEEVFLKVASEEHEEAVGETEETEDENTNNHQKEGAGQLHQANQKASAQTKKH